MSKLQVTTTNHILIDGKNTGLSVTQRENGTVVYTPESRLSGIAYREHAMPHARYSLAHDHPASGAAGRSQFLGDIQALLKTLGQ